MSNSFVNRKDRIIASAIEIISDAGVTSLTTKTLAMRENMSESLLYRYFGGIEEVLEEVIATFLKFDKGMFATIQAKDISHLDKVLELLKMYGTYYAGYKELGAIILNYEVFLHNVNTREAIAECIAKRNQFMIEEFAAAIEEGEIIDTFSPEELADIFLGSADRDLLNRRIRNDDKPHEEFVQSIFEKIAQQIRIK